MIFSEWIRGTYKKASAGLHQTYVAANAAVENQTPYTAPEMPLNEQRFIQISFNLLLLLYFWGYFARHGRTPAQALFRLRVVSEAGGPPSSSQALARAFAIIFSMLVVLWGLGSLFYFSMRDHLR